MTHPARRNYWPDSSRPNWCQCVEGDPHLCKPELHPTSPVHGAGTRPIPRRILEELPLDPECECGLPAAMHTTGGRSGRDRYCDPPK